MSGRELDPEVARHSVLIREGGPLARPVEAVPGICTQCKGPVDTDTGWCHACLEQEEVRRRALAPRRIVRRPRRRRNPPDPALAEYVARRDELNALMRDNRRERTLANYRRRDALNDRIYELEYGGAH